MKQNLNSLYHKFGIAVTIALVTFLSSPTFAFAQEEGGGTDIGGMITNVANYLTRNFTTALTAVAILAIVWRVIRALLLGADHFAKAKEEVLYIIIFYAVGLAASQIIATIANAVNGSGGSYG
ncbi:TrbC/VirB2 family protein [Aerococcaceae bacterium NML191219]|nr:TrbC/VirB2 family protein [Aerococcaceae bacterium NML191219]